MQTSTMLALIRSKTKLVVEEEYRFHPVRRWRFDIAIPSLKVALEIEGGAWTGGRHNSPTGFLADMEKYNEAAMMGWRVFRCTPQQVTREEAADLLLRVIEASKSAWWKGMEAQTGGGDASCRQEHSAPIPTGHAHAPTATSNPAPSDDTALGGAGAKLIEPLTRLTPEQFKRGVSLAAQRFLSDKHKR